MAESRFDGAANVGGFKFRLDAVAGLYAALVDADLSAALESLLPALDAIAAALTRQNETLAAAAEGRHDPHTARRRASAAYGRVGLPHDPPPGPPTKPT